MRVQTRTAPESGFAAISILVVDDNPHMRALLRAMLKAIGVRAIVEAGGGARAIDILQIEDHDIVIADLMMEEGDGLALIRQIRRDQTCRNRQVPIIVLTAHSERAHIEAARDAGVNEILVKPLSVSGLLKRILAVVETPRLFIQTDAYVGPDRRRRKAKTYNGPLRRWNDESSEVLEEGSS